MNPEEKAEISRANGAKSQGPKSPEGKAASSQNALQHGLTAETVILAGESADSFQQLLDDYIAELQPVGQIERGLVHRMVVAKWREQRAWTFEAASFNRRMPDLPGDTPPTAPLADAFLSLSDSSRSLERLYSYENAITRRFDRAHLRLMELQEQRRGVEPRRVVVQWVDSRTNGNKRAPETENLKTNPAPVQHS